jgi:methylated-DNA-[protein]-cysteine S-methyltransferase
LTLAKHSAEKGHHVKMLSISRLASPLGELLLVGDGPFLCALDYAGFEERMLKLLWRRYGQVTLNEAADDYGFGDRIRTYFDGDYAAIDAIPVSSGGTAFQEQVWGALRTIPAGTALSYGALAERLGRPRAARAVGAANALNPISIVVPCHRLIGADACLTGYAGGLERKRWLLEHEHFVPVDTTQKRPSGIALL